MNRKDIPESSLINWTFGHSWVTCMTMGDNQEVRDVRESSPCQQQQPGLVTQLSQGDMSVDEEMVMPVQATLVTRDTRDNDDSGCTSDGDHSDEDQDNTMCPTLTTEEKRNIIIRQNTYTVTTASASGI